MFVWRLCSSNLQQLFAMHRYFWFAIELAHLSTLDIFEASSLALPPIWQIVIIYDTRQSGTILMFVSLIIRSMRWHEISVAGLVELVSRLSDFLPGQPGTVTKLQTRPHSILIRFGLWSDVTRLWWSQGGIALHSANRSVRFHVSLHLSLMNFIIQSIYSLFSANKGAKLIPLEPKLHLWLHSDISLAPPCL